MPPHTAANELSLTVLKTACSNCNLRELCLPFGLSIEELERLDSLVSNRRRLKRESVPVGGEHVVHQPTLVVHVPRILRHHPRDPRFLGQPDQLGGKGGFLSPCVMQLYFYRKAALAENRLPRLTSL
jgi:hypothetical protein